MWSDQENVVPLHLEKERNGGNIKRPIAPRQAPTASPLSRSALRAASADVDAEGPAPAERQLLRLQVRI
jgi:hypothetical protein